MKHFIFTLFIGLLYMLPQESSGQSHCKDYHKFNCQPATQKGFKQNGQSRSALLKLGVPTELSIIVYKGQDYRISFCKDEKVIGKNILFRLVETTREPVGDVANKTDREKEYAVLDDNGEQTGITIEKTPGEEQEQQLDNQYEEVAKVLWDNTEHELAQEVEFTCTASKRLVIEVVAPGPDNEEDKKKNKADHDLGCVGVLIEHMPSPEVGF